MKVKTITERPKEVPVICEADVCVIGGGPAGIGAALGSARTGAKTVLIERFGCLGGMQTTGLQCQYTFVDDKIQGGIVKEMIERLEEAGALYVMPQASENQGWGSPTGCMYFDAEYYKHMLDTVMIEAGVELYYHAFAVDAVVKNNMITTVIIETKEGRRAIEAKAFVDCTGTGDIAWKAGASCLGDEGCPDTKYDPSSKGQHMGYGWVYYINNVDREKFNKYASENKEWELFGRGKSAIKKAKENGELYLLRSSLVFLDHPDGRYWVMGPGFTLDEGRHPWEVEMMTKGEIDLRNQAWSLFNFLKKNVPGFENAYIEQTPMQPLLRDGHRIEGNYILTDEDMKKGRHFEDSIGVCNMPPDLFFPSGAHRFEFNDALPYDIPYRALVSKDYSNLLGAGGTCSLNFYAWAAVRYATPSTSTGQAAGTAAALSALNGTNAKDLDVVLIQEALKKQGLVITNKDLSNETIEEYRTRGERFQTLKL